MAKKSPSPVDKYVGARVRMRRTMLGLSQTDLGAGLGVTFQQVQKYEKGTNRIGASRLQQLATIMKVPVEFFFEQPNPASFKGAPSVDYVTEFLSSSDGLALTKAFQRIASVKLRRHIVNLVEEVAGE